MSGFRRPCSTLAAALACALASATGAGAAERAVARLGPHADHAARSVVLAGDLRETLPSPSWRSEPLQIPAGATLDVGYGVRGQPPEGMRFRVSLCRGDACTMLLSEPAPAADAWQDRSLRLGDAAGQAATLVFEVESPASGAAPAWSRPILYAPAAPGSGERSLLLVSLDTLRADHLGSYGYARRTSPFLDGLAEQGTLFERAISTATTTGPSHMSMFTGLAPGVHGVYSALRRLPDGVPTLAGVLRERGYATAAVTEDGPMGAHRGFDRGFDSYVENKSKDVGSHAGHIETTLARGLAWLRRNRDRQSFLFLHTFQVHTPYAPPQEYLGLFRNDGVDPRATRSLPRQWQPHRYDREIRYADTVLQQWFDVVERERLLDDTVVVVLSDHGEEFLDHGALVHGPALYDEVLRVPLIVLGPGVAAGRRVDGTVSLVDLMPSLLELATGDTDDSGRSFAGATRASTPQPVPERPIFSESWVGRELRPQAGGLEWRDVPSPGFAVRRGSHKLIRYAGPQSPRYEFYDLASDPGERIDRYDAADPSVAELRRLLDAYRADNERAQARLRGAQPAGEAELDPERIEKLRALGYLD